MKTKELAMLLVALGVFALAGTTSAAEIVLQPAADAVSPGSATTNFESLRVGVAGQGGVTFFNGSIVNESGPMVIADDLRVDGEIWRGESKGDGDGKPLKISDSMVPTLTGLNNLGYTDLRWRGIYSQKGFFSQDVTIDGLLSVKGAASFVGGYGDGGVSVVNDGRLKVENVLQVDGDSHFWGGYTLTGSATGTSIFSNGIKTNGNIRVDIINPGDDALSVANDTRTPFSVSGTGDVNVEGNISDASDNFVDFTDIIKLEKTIITHACDEEYEGAMYYNTLGNNFLGCDGTSWVQLNP